MALYALRLRRALSLSSSIFTQTFHQPNPLSSIPPSLSQNNSSTKLLPFPYQSSRLFRSSTISQSSRFDRNRNPADEEIGPDTILFEGCDYEHWLITIDFPKDTQLTREEMIETYVQTAAKVFGRSANFYYCVFYMLLFSEVVASVWSNLILGSVFTGLIYIR